MTAMQSTVPAMPGVHHHGWVWLLFSGILSVLLGALLIIEPFVAAAAFSQVIGAFMLVGSVFSLFAVASIGTHRRTVWMWVTPILTAFLGAVLLFWPILALEGAMLVLGMLSIVAGILAVVTTVAAWNAVEHHWITVMMSLMTALGGVCILLFPAMAIWIFSLWFGVLYLFHGAYLLAAIPQVRQIDHARHPPA